ncbi:MAG: fumarylacetoacetate hydrolase family protein [Bacteroidaceae bacterium]|nr:fumarylacetoacetate hydrolase family protein [Bacteroidaceae bacterium]
MKIIAVGMNYAAHNKELNPTLLRPKAPVIFTKPDSAVLRKRMPFFIPDFADRFDYEAEIVVRICRLGRHISQKFAHRYYDAVTVGIDFTARDLQTRLREGGLPWDLCKGFDDSAAIGQFVNVKDLGNLQDLRFHLDIDGKTVQEGWTGDMIFTIDEIVSFASRFFTLKMGDLIFTGTPAGVGPVSEGMLLQGYLGDRQVLDLKIK